MLKIAFFIRNRLFIIISDIFAKCLNSRIVKDILQIKINSFAVRFGNKLNRFQTIAAVVKEIICDTDGRNLQNALHKLTKSFLYIICRRNILCATCNLIKLNIG